MTDLYITHATFTTKVGVSFIYHMNDDMPEVNGLTPSMLPGSLLPSENESLGTRLMHGQYVHLECSPNRGGILLSVSAQAHK